MQGMSDAQLRGWVENWNTVGKVFDALRRKDLVALTDDDVRRMVDDLFSGPYPFDLPSRAVSGLVEQQRWFAKSHDRAR